jgi:chloride channel protein, CIC family
MSGRALGRARAPGEDVVTAGVGGLLGGLVGGLFVVGVTVLLKEMLAVVSAQRAWLLVVLPLAGVALAVLVLQGFGRPQRKAPRRWHAWRTFPPDSPAADITHDVMETAGEEERFPWRLAPLRAIAILATVGSGGAMGSEAPAAYLGVAVGAFLGDRGQWWRQLLQPAALGGGAAGVAAVIGIPLVGTAYMLEVGWGHKARLTAERLTAAVIGGLIGWAINAALHLDLVRLVAPDVAPVSLGRALGAPLLIGVSSGVITSAAGLAIYRAKKWQAPPAIRLLLGGTAMALTAFLLLAIAAPSAAIGPGGGAIQWAQGATALPFTLFVVCLLRAAATTALAAAGGCGGVFVPFLAVGDLAGRAFVPSLGIGPDLAGSAGAAGGIAGGYRLPFTAVALVLGIGGSVGAMLTCLATAGVAFLAGATTESVIERAKGISLLGTETPVH